MSDPIIRQQIEPIPFNEESRDELERLQTDMARMMDDMIMQAFMAAAHHGPHAVTRTVDRPDLTADEIRSRYAQCQRMRFYPTNGEPINRPSCAQCGKPNLNQTYTSTRDQRDICAGCFEGLQDKGLAREQGQPMKKKVRHPLDAWMEE